MTPVAMEEKQYEDLVKQINKDAADYIDKGLLKATENINKEYEKVAKGTMTADEFKEFKEKELKPINDALAKVDKLEEALKAQGTKIGELEAAPKNGTLITFEDFFEQNFSKEKLIDLRATGKNIAFTAKQLKAAGITSIGNTITDMTSPPGSPYMPGIGGSDLSVFEIVRNPNFMLSKVDLGRTSQSRLAWINETDFQGTVNTAVAEGGSKPLTQHKFQAELSIAKKAAAYIEITEEFQDDLPQLATMVRRMLEEDVFRAWDDTIQTAVQTVARPYEITGLTHDVDKPNKYDAIGAEHAQVEFYNFPNVNTVAINPVTKWSMFMSKNDVVTSGPRDYINPPFWDIIQRNLVTATKMLIGYALVGDLKQYKVDIYKDFTLRTGWINDDLIKNQFAVVGELRYHNYISDNRKKAIVYDALATIISAIQSGS